MTDAAAPRRGHIEALDGVRGLAIIAVFLYHAMPDLSPQWRYGFVLTRAVSAGPFGVDLFFVLSGFLITGILIAAREKVHYFKNFYARRVLRLFPVYYAYLLVLMFVIPLIHRALHTSMEEYSGPWWWYLAYFCNWKPNFGWRDAGLGHIWSLAVEEQFYLIWPTIVLLAGRRRLPWVCGALILSATALRCVWSAQGATWNQIYRLTVTRWDTMAFGALAALAVRSESWLPIAKRWAPRLMLGGTVIFCALAIYAGGPDWSRAPIQTVGSTFASLAFTGLVLFAATAQAGPLHRLLRRPLLLAMGKYSYFIYVVHGLVISHVYWVGEFIVKKRPATAVPVKLGLLGVVSVLVFYLAKLSWRFFEAPILKLKRHFD